MIVYECRVCGYVFDEAIEGRAFSTLECCPSCGQPLTSFDIKLKADAPEAGEVDSPSKPAHYSGNEDASDDVLDAIVSGRPLTSSEVDQLKAKLKANAPAVLDIISHAAAGAAIGAAVVSTASSISTAREFSEHMRSR